MSDYDMRAMAFDYAMRFNPATPADAMQMADKIYYWLRGEKVKGEK